MHNIQNVLRTVRLRVSERFLVAVLQDITAQESLLFHYI